jgi:hypothetical protein
MLSKLAQMSVFLGLCSVSEGAKVDLCSNVNMMLAAAIRGMTVPVESRYGCSQADASLRLDARRMARRGLQLLVVALNRTFLP